MYPIHASDFLRPAHCIWSGEARHSAKLVAPPVLPECNAKFIGYALLSTVAIISVEAEVPSDLFFVSQFPLTIRVINGAFIEKPTRLHKSPIQVNTPNFSYPFVQPRQSNA